MEIYKGDLVWLTGVFRKDREILDDCTLVPLTVPFSERAPG